MAERDERSLRTAKNSARNGSVVASTLLFGFMIWENVTPRDWTLTLGMAFLLSQITFGSTFYYERAI